MLSPKMLKSPKFTFSQVERGVDSQLLGSKNGSQLLMLSPKILKSQIHIFRRWEGGGLAANF